MTHCGKNSDNPGNSPSGQPDENAAPILSRRRFLRTTAAACGALAAPMLIPASALGRGGSVAPSERIVMGAIGVGGRGTFDLNAFLHEKDAQVVAVCDVQRIRRDNAKTLVDEFYGNKDCLTYRDFRELVARPDIDAVTFVTSDRWHAPGAQTVMAAGKDVYCEKPGSLAIDESQRLVLTARRYGRIFQSGIQRLSEANFIIAGELARTGRLGKVHTVYAHLYHIPVWPRKRVVILPAQPEPDREEVDWDLWLGACAWRPFNSDYMKHGGWRVSADMSTGIAEWGSHTIAQCQVDLGLADTSPVAYEYPVSGDAEGFTAHFANGLKLVLTRDGWSGTCGVRLRGVGRGGWPSPTVTSAPRSPRRRCWTARASWSTITSPGRVIPWATIATSWTASAPAGAASPTRRSPTAPCPPITSWISAWS